MPFKREEATYEAIGCAIAVHRALGPGLLESTYCRCFAHKLRTHGFSVETEVPVAVEFEGLRVDCGYRIDMIAGGRILFELKSTRHLLPIHSAQTLTYLKLSGLPWGFLLNFNVRLLKNGLKSFVNDQGRVSERPLVLSA